MAIAVPKAMSAVSTTGCNTAETLPPQAPRRAPVVNVQRDGWTAEALDALRELWAEGLSTLAIGREMRTTKNAVVGKARRLNLPPRPSPIGQQGPLAVPRARVAPAPRRRAARAEISTPAGAAAAPVPSAARGSSSTAPRAAAGLLPGGPAGAAVAAFAAPAPTPAPAPQVAPPAPAPREGGAPVRALSSPHRTCRMPLWPHRATREHPDFGRRFCDAPSVAGTSWCARCLGVVASKVRAA